MANLITFFILLIT